MLVFWSENTSAHEHTIHTLEPHAGMCDVRCATRTRKYSNNMCIHFGYENDFTIGTCIIGKISVSKFVSVVGNGYSALVGMGIGLNTIDLHKIHILSIQHDLMLNYISGYVIFLLLLAVFFINSSC